MINKMLFYSLFFFVVFTFLSCNNERSGYIYNEGFIYGTFYHIVYDHPKNLNIKDEIVSELLKIDRSLSTFNDSSVISKINQNIASQTDRLFNEVFLQSKEIAEITNGAFDPTVAPLVNAWGFGFKNEENVTSAMIDSLKQFVGYDKVSLSGDILTKNDKRVMLDFSAIAKGFSVDVIAGFLEKKGCVNYMVEIGGEVKANGVNEQGRTWRIGINEPNDDEPAFGAKYMVILDLNGLAVATSGNYRNFYMKNGKKYAHTINPETGYPVQHRLLSATVVAQECMVADAFATAFMVMGKDKAMKVASNEPSIEAFLVWSDKDTLRTLQTAGFEKMISKE